LVLDSACHDLFALYHVGDEVGSASGHGSGEKMSAELNLKRTT